MADVELCQSCAAREEASRREGKVGFVVCEECRARLDAAAPPVPMADHPPPWRWKEPLGEDEMPVLLDRDGDVVCHFGDATQYYPSEGEPPEGMAAAVIEAAGETDAFLRNMVNLMRRLLPAAAKHYEQDWTTTTAAPFPAARATLELSEKVLARIDERAKGGV